MNDSRNTVSESRFESPQYIEFDDAANKITLLTGGLPYHRRVGYSKLDTVLIPVNESQRTFRFGIGIDLKNPLQSAMDFQLPIQAHSVSSDAGQADRGFFFHFDQRQLTATDWCPLTDAAGKISGVRIRLLECMSRPGKVTITAIRDIVKAQRTNFMNQLESESTIEAGKACFEFGANDYFQVELHW